MIMLMYQWQLGQLFDGFWCLALPAEQAYYHNLSIDIAIINAYDQLLLAFVFAPIN